MARVYNFSAGPSMLPEEVLKTAQAELLEYGSSGQSVMEMSHRSPVFDAIFQETKAAVRRGLQTDMATGVASESEAFGLCFATEDQKDAMAAFLKKEKLPGFKNK